MEAVAFGCVKIHGEKYENDLVIHANGEVTKRKKKKSKPLKPDYGHTPLSEKELDFLAEEKPKVIYVGTGYNGALPITPEALAILADYKTVILPTPEVLPKIEADKRRHVAIIHVTC
ncbi:MAG: hypothetical protein ACQCN6_13230 [Candidatus Bathyarchaeia archaeon]|jgi:hypothetical protein